MEAKEFDFELPRGDTCPVSFELTDAEGKPLEPATTTEIYFTMKRNYNTTNFILQKKYSTDGISLENGVGSLILEHNDTKLLSYGKYKYDIQYKDGDYVKTLVIGTITLTNEATHAANE